MAKRNKPETHFRLKPYLAKWIQEIAKLTESTMTSVVEDALEKGLSWRIKMIRKELDPNFLAKNAEQAPVKKYNKPKPEKHKEPIDDDEEVSEEELNRRLKKLYKKNEEPEEEQVSDEEVKKMIADLYKKHPKK